MVGAPRFELGPPLQPIAGPYSQRPVSSLNRIATSETRSGRLRSAEELQITIVVITGADRAESVHRKAPRVEVSSRGHIASETRQDNCQHHRPMPRSVRRRNRVSGSSNRRVGRSGLRLSSCTDDGVVITADEQRCASQQYGPLMAGRGVPLGVFYLRDAPGWQPLARDFVAALESQWPGKVRYRNGTGELISGAAAIPRDDTSAPIR